MRNFPDKSNAELNEDNISQMAPAIVVFPKLFWRMIEQKLITPDSYPAVEKAVKRSKNAEMAEALQKYDVFAWLQSIGIYRNGMKDVRLTEAFHTSYRETRIDPFAKESARTDIHWKGSELCCDPKVIIWLISCYANEWMRCTGQNITAMGLHVTLGDTEPAILPLADEIAALINQDDLNAMLNAAMDEKNYRHFLLAWARYAGEGDVEKWLGQIKRLERGNSHEREKAKNIHEALMLSDTRAAMLHFDQSDALDRYAGRRGTTAMDMRDQDMMPRFGLDERGVKRYDICGRIIEARLGEDLTFSLFDVSNQRALRCMPKKSYNPKKAAAADADYTQLKADVSAFAGQRAEILRKMHITGERVSEGNWHNVYLNNPVVRRLTEHIVWQDEKGKTFIVNGDTLTDSCGEAYSPVGSIAVAHVITTDKDDIERWQRILGKTGKTELFEQMWEPVIEFDTKTLPTRYTGLQLGMKQRNALKSKLSGMGIRVWSDDMRPAFGSYRKPSFGDHNTMHFGNRISATYRILNERREIEIEKMSISASDSREAKASANAVVLELDKLAVGVAIGQNRIDGLSEMILDRFNAPQILEFIDQATKCNAIDCTALLLDYKRRRYPEYDVMQTFVLDW